MPAELPRAHTLPTLTDGRRWARRTSDRGSKMAPWFPTTCAPSPEFEEGCPAPGEPFVHVNTGPVYVYQPRMPNAR